MESTATLPEELPPSDWPEWEWFYSIEELLLRCRPIAKAHEASAAGFLFPFLDSIIESVDSLRALITELKLRDSYVIARVIYETSINACFLLTDPNALALRATVHAKQKALRSLVRAIEVAGDRLFEFKRDGAEELLGDPRHQEWLKEFTSRSGREITSWTPENVQQRLEAAYLKFGPDDTHGLALGLLIYRHASEIAHGTLYGTLFAWGGMEPGRPVRSVDDIREFRRRELRHLMKLVAHSLESLIRIVAPALEVPDVSVGAENARKKYYEQRARDV
jgi:hypothetical protein